MDSKAHELRREHWRKIILECNNRKPGVTKRDWCQSSGINIKSLYYWQHQFRSEAVSSLETPVAHKAQSSPFLDITGSITDCFEQNTTTSAGNASRPLAPELMIQTRGCRIYVNGSIREQTLEVVLRALRNA